MPTLYIMCGLPFSGKTYLGKLIAKNEHKCILLSYDEMWQQNFEATGKDTPWEELTAQAYQTITDNLILGNSAVYDTLNDNPYNRNKLAHLAHSLNCNYKIIYLDFSVELIKSRLNINRLHSTRHDVSDENFANALNSFQPPEGEANVIRITEKDIADTSVFLAKVLASQE